MTEPRLAAQQHQPVPQLGMGIHVESAGRGRVDHPVVGHHHQPDLVGQGLAQLHGLGVDGRELLEPLRRVHAVLVAGPVEVTVVEVGQRRAVARAGDRAGDPLPDPVRADVAGAPVRGDGQPAAVELALVDHVDPDPCVGEPGEGGRMRLPLQRVHRLVPEQRVQQPVGAGHPAGEADQPVGARGQAGAQRGQAGGRRRRDPRRPGLGTGHRGPGQRGEVRRGVGMALQQLPAEAVDQEHDIGLGLGQHQAGRRLEHVGAEGAADRRDDVAEPSVTVGRLDEGRGRRRRQPTGHPAWVRAESCSAKDSRSATASAPSAAAEARREKSSEASTPV